MYIHTSTDVIPALTKARPLENPLQNLGTYLLEARSSTGLAKSIKPDSLLHMFRRQTIASFSCLEGKP